MIFDFLRGSAIFAGLTIIPIENEKDIINICLRCRRTRTYGLMYMFRT